MEPLVTSIVTDSERLTRSRQIRWNSAEGKVTVASYSVCRISLRKNKTHIGNAHVLAIDIHEFDIIFTHSLLLCGFKHEIQRVGHILGLNRDDIIVLSRAEDFGQRVEVDS